MIKVLPTSLADPWLPPSAHVSERGQRRPGTQRRFLEDPPPQAGYTYEAGQQAHCHKKGRADGGGGEGQAELFTAQCRLPGSSPSPPHARTVPPVQHTPGHPRQNPLRAPSQRPLLSHFLPAPTHTACIHIPLGKCSDPN